TCLVHSLSRLVPAHTDRAKRGPWHRPMSSRRQGPFTYLPPNRSSDFPHMRILTFGELKSLKHIGWNEEYIAQLVGAGLFPAPIPPDAWRESHIDDWMKARKAKGDLSWMRFSLKERPSARPSEQTRLNAADRGEHRRSCRSQKHLTS